MENKLIGNAPKVRPVVARAVLLVARFNPLVFGFPVSGKKIIKIMEKILVVKK